MIRARQRQGGFTLVELLSAAGVTTAVLLVVFSSAYSLSRSLAFSERMSRQSNDEGRVADYIARDFRGALAASLANSVLTITIPDYFNGSTPRDATIVAGKVQYSATPMTVKYYFQNGSVIREVNGTAVEIAQNVASFTMDDTAAVTTPGTVIVAPRIPTTGVLNKVAIKVIRAKTPTN